MDTIAVIDYGMGNLRSVAKAIEHVAGNTVRVIVTSEPKDVHAAQRIVFPGQGAARDCMKELDQRGLRDSIRFAAETKPFLGICMGMQVLADLSDEDGGVECLALVPGRVRSLRAAQLAAQSDAPNGPRLKIPHMGWNALTQAQDHPLWKNIPQNAYFYFVHSFYFDPAEQACVAGTTDYGVQFTSAISRKNLFAIQCHPEKSAEPGLTLLSNFLKWSP